MLSLVQCSDASFLSKVGCLVHILTKWPWKLCYALPQWSIALLFVLACQVPTKVINFDSKQASCPSDVTKRLPVFKSSHVSCLHSFSTSASLDQILSWYMLIYYPKSKKYIHYHSMMRRLGTDSLNNNTDVHLRHVQQ